MVTSVLLGPILLRCFVGGFGHVCCTGCGFLPRLLDLRCVGVVCIVCFAISGCCVVVSWLVAFGVYFGV